MNKKIMAIILNYNAYEDSIKCAEWLKKQTYEKLQITIVDNNSTNNSAELLAPYCNDNNILFLQSKVNGGYSAGNNVGLKKATELGCDYALIINPDVEIRDEKYVEKCIKEFEKEDEVVVLGSDVVTVDGKHQNPMRELNFFENTFWFVMAIVLRFIKKDIYVGDYHKTSYVHKLTGCCFFIKVDFAKEIGYLDDNVFLYCEEPILAACVKKLGYKEKYFANAIAYHMHKNLGHGASAESLGRFLDSRIYYIKKYRYATPIKQIVIASMKLEKKVLLLRARKR